MHDYTTSWGGFQIRNVSFWERLDGRTHEYYHSVGITQARPKYYNAG